MDKTTRPRSMSIVGTPCRVRRGSRGEAIATIIRERRVYLGTESTSQYYIHFHQTDTRFDRWIQAEEVLEYDEDLASDEFDSDLLDDLEADTTSLRSLTKPALFEGYPVKNIQRIYLQEHWVPAWYPSPYPEGYTQSTQLFICPICFQFFMFFPVLQQHETTCSISSLYSPETLVYQKNQHSVHQFNGQDHVLPCQNLCLFSKLFIAHKNLCYRVSNFVFYILLYTDPDTEVATPVGYFSRELGSPNNLACIFVSPLFQRRGFGRFLIEFSYKLSRIEGRLGSPERPLSVAGAKSYHVYWSEALADALLAVRGSISLKTLSQITCITQDDIISTFHFLDLPISALHPSRVLHALKVRNINIQALVDPVGFVGALSKTNR